MKAVVDVACVVVAALLLQTGEERGYIISEVLHKETEVVLIDGLDMQIVIAFHLRQPIAQHVEHNIPSDACWIQAQHARQHVEDSHVIMKNHLLSVEQY